MADAPVTRRRFLDSLCYASLAATAVAALAPIPAYLVPPSDRLRRVVVGKASEFAPRTARKFAWGPKVGVVVHDGTTLRVLDARCTHQGCKVGWDEPAALFVCPCHGARFAPDGTPVKGPHRGPLAALPFRVTESGDVEVGD